MAGPPTTALLLQNDKLQQTQMFTSFQYLSNLQFLNELTACKNILKQIKRDDSLTRPSRITSSVVVASRP